jgi:thiamine biosynthesis lipoprotein
MKQTKLIMGMPITIEIADEAALEDDFDEVFSYFDYVDNKFSPYKKESELARLNAGSVAADDLSEDMCVILDLAEETKRETGGYFDVINRAGLLDPSGLVKGWAVKNAADILERQGFRNFYVDAGGDIEARGWNEKGESWSVGIRDPFASGRIVKTVRLTGRGIATSGSYERGHHIYDPHDRRNELADIVSLTVIGPNVYEADRFATAAFAMGKAGVGFIEKLAGLEGYSIDHSGIATMTSGFKKYVA